MAVKNTGLSTAAIRGEFFNRLSTVQTYYQDLCTRIPSTSEIERHRWLGTVPQMREWGSGRLAKGLRAESYDITNHKYEATLEVDRDEVADDQLGQIRIRVGELAVRAGTHKDYLMALLLNSGHSAGYLAYDGQIFFSAAHVSGGSGTQDNDLTGAAATGTAPTVGEFKGALGECITAMMGFKDDQGQPMSFSPTGLVAVVPPAMFYTALEAVGAAVISATTNIMQNVCSVIALPWLSSAATFFVLKTDAIVRPFIFQDREPIEFAAQAEGTEQEFLREKYLYGVRARYAIRYGYWQYAVRFIFT